MSLFFIPTIPFKTEYFFYCSICGNSKKLDKDEFELILPKTKPYG